VANFLAIALGFPTAVFTGLLVLCLLYWALVMVGALDIDLFSVDLDFDADVDVDADMPDAGGLGFVGDVLSFLGFGKVPLMILISFFAFFGWILSFMGTWQLGALGGSTLVTVSISFAVLGVATVGGLLMGSFAARPLAPIFATAEGRNNKSLIGEAIVLSTGRVDGRFGQGQVDIADSDLLVQVRCDDTNTLARGDRALIISFDTARDAFVVEPMTPGE